MKIHAKNTAVKRRLWVVMAAIVAVGCVGNEGPAGPAGPAGPVGAQGPAGYTGATGDEGPSGPKGLRGPSGSTGATGARGATGATGAAGVTGLWVSYRDFWFESGKAEIRLSDMSMVLEIADYMEKNPLIQIGIDSFSVQPNQDLRDRRIRTVFSELINAGVPAERLWTGALGDPKNRLASRVELLVVNRRN